MAARVVEAALDHPPVTFALHGHPLVAALPPFLVLELAAALDLRVTILPGVSALDALLADLRLDPVVASLVKRGWQILAGSELHTHDILDVPPAFAAWPPMKLPLMVLLLEVVPGKKLIAV